MTTPAAKASGTSAKPAPASKPTPTASTTTVAAASNTAAAAVASNTAAGEYLLDRLRILLSRLQTAHEILQKWPEARGDSARVHADTAAELIASVRRVALGARGTERHVNGTGPASTSSGGAGGGGGAGSTEGGMSKESLAAFRSSLDTKCPIPLDLLDLLDVGQPFGLHPQCYARGVLTEAMRQLAGLERRKRTLDMLARAVEGGMGGGRGEKEESEEGRGGREAAVVNDGPGGPQEEAGGKEDNENVSKRKRKGSDGGMEGEGVTKKMAKTE